MSKARSKQTVSLLDSDPLWYKDAVIYEIHVRAFRDSNGDGIGDFRGLVEKLDYLQDLGVTALWILPFYPSPLKDDGYDIADYTTVNPSYGTLRDFRYFLNAAHERGLRVITELVINHTSSEHPWFQKARQAPVGSKLRDFYVWSDSPERYKGTRIIFQDFETSNWSWDPVARAYYWHRFYSHQPDLNFDNPAVHSALFKVLDFWMDMGVDGLRLDAIPYLYEREGTNCENLAETHTFLRKLRAHMDSKYENRMLLAEANQWPEDAAEYFGDGDECHMNFHFPLMPRMFMAVQQENSFPILDILEQTPDIPESCQWALFLRNHDELTLEMVTDQDRDYMYRVYAEDPQARINVGIRRRLAPLLQERRKIELLNGLLMSLPGTPVLYYGDEIGMGDNIYLGDRNGVRTPMQWSGDRNAGFSDANPQKLFLPVIIDPEHHYESTNVEAQQGNSASLLWWMKRLLALRREHKVFGRGSVTFLSPDNPKVLAFLREYEGERILVVANLSRFSQYVEIDLRDHEGAVPFEIFGRTEFPAIGAWPYLLTLGPHGFYWFQLRDDDLSATAHNQSLPMVEVIGAWDRVAKPGNPLAGFDQALRRHLLRSRWFRGKAREIRSLSILGSLPLASGSYQLATVRVEYVNGLPETYAIPLGFDQSSSASESNHDHAAQHIAHLHIKPARGGSAKVKDGVVYDAGSDPVFGSALLRFAGKKRSTDGKGASASAYPRPLIRGIDLAGLEAFPLAADQSNTAFLFSDRLFMKLLRHLDFGVHPDVEVCDYLGTTEFGATPALAAHLEISVKGQTQTAALAMVSEQVSNQGDAWRLTTDAVTQAFERALVTDIPAPVSSGTLLSRASHAVPDAARDIIGGFLGMIELLGYRTAEMHLALAASSLPAFLAEDFSTLHQRSLYQSARTTLVQSLDLLKKRGPSDPDLVPIIKRVVSAKGQLSNRLKGIVGEKIEATRIRCHGDYHLGQVLFTGNDFAILDFEGEPTRSLGERRLKASPIKDVAGMLRSFYYAAGYALRHGAMRSDDIPRLEQWARAWPEWVGATFLRSYLERTAGASFIPADTGQLERLLDFYLVEKCSYELSYELQSRPDWVGIPLYGLHELID